MVDIKLSVSIIILNVNLNIPTKIQRPKDSMKKQDPTICYLQEIHFKHKVISWKSKEMEKDRPH